MKWRGELEKNHLEDLRGLPFEVNLHLYPTLYRNFGSIMRMLRTRTTSIVSNWPQSCNYNIIVAFIMLVSLENLLKTTDIFQVLRLSVCLSVYFPAYLLWKACSTRKFSIFFQAALLNILQKKNQGEFFY